MDFKEYFAELKAQKQIDKLAKKYKKKKIAIYGAGQFCRTLFENYDLSKLNIVAVADRSFNGEGNENFYGLKCITPNDLKELDCNVILIGTYETFNMHDYLEDELLVDCKNSNIKIRPLIKESLFHLIKELIKGE